MTTVLRLLDDMQFYKLELVNCEQNYNKAAMDIIAAEVGYTTRARRVHFFWQCFALFKVFKTPACETDIYIYIYIYDPGLQGCGCEWCVASIIQLVLRSLS